MTRRLVIDADVARSSGTESKHAGAARCADALTAVLANHELRAVFSQDLFDEWRKHGSRVAMRWLSAMKSRRRHDMLTPPTHVPTDDAIYELRDDAIFKILMKDHHIVDLAMATDRRILSLDNKARRHFKALGTCAEIHWAHPADERCVPWIRETLPDDPTFRLG